MDFLSPLVRWKCCWPLAPVPGKRPGPDSCGAWSLGWFQWVSVGQFSNWVLDICYFEDAKKSATSAAPCLEYNIYIYIHIYIYISFASFLATLRHCHIWPTACRNFCSVFDFFRNSRLMEVGNSSWRSLASGWITCWNPLMSGICNFHPCFIHQLKHHWNNYVEIIAICDAFWIVSSSVRSDGTSRQCAPWLVGGAAYVSWGVSWDPDWESRKRGPADGDGMSGI